MSYNDIIVKKLNEQRHQGSYCDIEIHIGGNVYFGHKCVFAAASSRLESDIKDAEMINSEPSILHRSKIELCGISTSGFETVLNFIYSGNLEINEENENDVCDAAMVLDVKMAVKACADFKREKFAVCNLLAVNPLRRSITNAVSTSTDPKLYEINEETFATSTVVASRSCDFSLSSSGDMDHDNVASDNNSVSSIIKIENDRDLNDISSLNNRISVPSCTAVASLSAATSQGLSNSDQGFSYANLIQTFDVMGKDPLALPTLLPNTNVPRMFPALTNSEVAGENYTSTSDRYQLFYSEEVNEAGDVVWRCNICQKLFGKLSYLKYVHIGLHNGVRPHACNVCGKHFATKGNLIQHHKVHLAKKGVLPHKCKFCKRAFALKGNCHKHEKTHTKPYRCEFCPRSFSNKNDCMQHIFKHHPNEPNTDDVGTKCFTCNHEFLEPYGEDYLSHKCPK